MEQKINYEELVNLFVGKDEMRPLMLQPFKQNGLYCATDAHALITIPQESIEFVCEEQDKPDIAPITSQENNSNISFNVSSLEGVLMPKMIEEEIEESKEVECNECGGDGEVEWEYSASKTTYEREFACPVCEGEGILSSAIFTKTGKMIADENTYFNLYGTIFSYKQLHRIVNAAKTLQAERLFYTITSRDKVNKFVIGIANVIVMPIVIYDDKDKLKAIEIKP